tara:strand:- start:150 stop:491 length:342 start_codon:yes stop_codon:yes gene_type:complete
MKKILVSLSLIILLTGCAESMALLGTASSVASGGNIVQSSMTSAVNYGIKKQTGKNSLEHVASFVEENNKNNKKEKCVKFLENTNSKLCSAVKSKITDVRASIKHKSKIKYLD